MDDTETDIPLRNRQNLPNSTENNQNSSTNSHGDIQNANLRNFYQDILKEWADQKPGNYKNAAEYSSAVHDWLCQCYYWQTVSMSFPLYLWSCFQQPSNGTNTTSPSVPNGFPNWNFNPTATNIVQQTPNVNQHPLGREYILPSIWKRFAAECIDFFILFLIKLLITFVAVDYFSVIDLNKYNITELPNDLLHDYKLALEMTSDIVLLEFAHKIVVCIFEGLCLHRGAGGVGGATPGKSALGLKVVSCETVIELGENRVVVQPASDIGLGSAFLRSFIKNFTMAFFLPVCFTMLVFQHNRAVYDVVCNCIVVEEPRPHRR